MSMGYGFGFTRARRASSGGGGGVSAPVNTVLPVITGTTTQGELLSVSNGTWTNSPSSYAYQWKRAGSNISGATSATYVLVLADVGSTVTCTVTATNAGGATSATSTATATIAAAGTQTALFGSATNVPFRPYVGGVPVDITGTPTLLSGSAGGYTASVSGGGLYFGAGTGAPNGATYTCTLAAGGTVDVMVSVTANAYSVNTSGGITTTIATMRGISQTTDWTLILRGATYGTARTDMAIYGQTFSGTVVDSEASVLPENRNLLALATVSGGSVRIKSEVTWAAHILSKAECLGSGPFIWDEVDFSGGNTTDEGNSNSIPGLTKPTAASYNVLENGTNGTYPTVKAMIATKCRFGIGTTQPSTRFQCGPKGVDIVEQCYFDGFTIGIMLSNGGVARSNTFRNFVTDAVRFSFGGNVNAFIYGNEIYARNLDPEWDNEHGDGFQGGQFGASNDIYCEIHDNFAFYSDNQGMPYTDDTSGRLRGIIQNNFYWGFHLRSMNLNNPEDVLVRNNTYIEQADGSTRASSPPGLAMHTLIGPTGEGPMVVAVDNVWHRMDAISEDKGLDDGNVLIGQTGTAYDAAFAGTFTGGAGSPVLTFADTSEATRKATILAAFAVDPSGPAAGKGFQYLRTAYPALSSFGYIDGVALSTLTTSDPRTVLRGTGLAITATAGTEYEVRAADDTTVLTAWTSSSGTVDKGNKVRVRKTSSGTMLTSVTAQITVDGTAHTYPIATALTPPAVYWTVGSGSPNTYLFATANMSSGTNRLIGRATLYMTGSPAADCHLFGMATNAWMFRITTERKVEIGVKDSANATLLSGYILKDSLAADVVLAATQWLQIIFDVDYTAHTVVVTVNGVVYPTIAFTASGSGSSRQQPAIIGAGTVGGGNIIPAGWQLADVSIDRNGSNYKTVPNDATSVNADTWKAGAAAT